MHTQSGPLKSCGLSLQRWLVICGLAVVTPVAAWGASPTILLHDGFEANTPNTRDLNVDLARQTGTLAPIPYTMANGPGNYGHQLQHADAPNQLLLADFAQSTSSLNFNFGGVHSQNGLRIRVAVDAMPALYASPPDRWACINLGMSQADQMVNVNQALPHFGVLFRAAGTLQAFDGNVVVSPSPEPVYSTQPPGTTNLVEIVITGEDGNPFDGTGDTRIEIYANGSATPVWAYTKVGGFANNYINLQANYRAHVDSLEIAQLPEAPPPVIANPSFEADIFAGWPGYVSGNGPITGWSAAGGAGLNPAGGSAPFADNGAVPDGSQVAFMQEDSALSQVLSGFVVGRTYQLRYFENARTGPTHPFLAVTIGGQTIVPAHEVVPVGGSNPYYERVTDPFVATAAEMELAFIKSNPQGGDTTVLIDHVAFLASGTSPRIVTEPAGLVAGIGETATFTVGAVGSAPLNYQWYLDGAILPGGTGSTLSFLVEFVDQAGDYTVRVSNSAGEVESQAATLTVRASVPGLFNTGVDDTRAALADGAVDPHYTLVVNADSASSDALVQNSMAFPIVTGPWLANTAGSKWIGPRFDTTEAAGLASGNGEYVYRLTFDLTGMDLPTVVITGGWAIDNAGLGIRVNGNDIGVVNNNGFGGLTPFTIDSSNATFVDGPNTLDFVVQNTDAAIGYTGLRVGNLRGLAVLPGTPPTILGQPQSRLAGTGQTLTLSVEADGSTPLAYQWRKDDVALPGATGPTLTLTQLTRGDSGVYTVVVSNGAGTATSLPAELTVRDSVPGVLNTGVDDTGTALPDGVVDPHYALIVNPDSNSADAIVQDSTLVPIVAGPWLANNPQSKWIGPRVETSAAAGGAYTYRLTFDLTGFDPGSVEVLGEWTSDNPGTGVALNGVSRGITNDGNFAVLTPFAISGGFVAGYNTLDFVVTNAALGYTGLRLDHVLGLGDLLPDGTLPFIVEQPAAVTATVTETVEFRVRANGSGPLQYQWYLGPDALPGETGPTLTFPIEFPDQGGEYTVEVSNAFGSIRSDGALLTISELPSITQQPQSVLVAAFEDANFTVQAIGSAPLSYQWIYNGSDVPGATDPTLALLGVFPGDGGIYQVRVSNDAGSVLSDEAVLMVAEPVPGVHNTGVDDSGVILPDGAVDPHYRLMVNPDSASADALVQDSTLFPIVAGPWLPNTDQSKWIGPRLETSASAGGDYVYRLSFDLTGYDTTAAQITGNWSTDNQGLDIRFNGVATGQANPGEFAVYAPFVIQSGFRPGLNTIDFRLNNSALGYTGLRVDAIRALAVPLPEGTAPFLVEQPADVTADQNQTVILAVLANGSAPLSFQWFFGADPIPGATGPVHSFVAMSLSQSGEYSVEISNGAGTARSEPAVVTVLALPNQPPAFTAGPDLTVPEDTGPREYADWATAISAGPPSESGQALTFVVSTDNPGLFSAPPEISPDGTLTFTPTADLCGEALVTVVLQDDGGTAGGGGDTSEPAEFTITVVAVNDCPAAAGQSVTVAQGSSVPILLEAVDVDAAGCGEAAVLNYWVMPPAHGFLRGAPPNLTYTPAPDYCGADSFLFLVDDGICFDVATVDIEVIGVNRCPVADVQTVSTCQNTPVPVTLSGSDPDEAGCGATIQGFAIAQPPAHGTLSGMAPDVVYTPAPDFVGWDTFTFTVTDGECVSEPATVRIEVKSGNGAPVCQIVIGPRLQLTPEATGNVVLACDNLVAEVVLDATLCTDSEGGALTYMWLVDGLPVGMEAITSVPLELGAHEVTLVVEDTGGGTGECANGPATSTATAWVMVVDGCEAVEELILLVEQSDVHSSLKHTLAKELKDACKRFAKGKCRQGVKELEKFQDKVRHYDLFYKKPSKKLSAKKHVDHETAEVLVNAAQAIIDQYLPCDCMGPAR